MTDSQLNECVEQMRQARRVVVLTGAGMSAESGIPTFRQALSGLWEKFDPAALATPEAFAENPQTVSQWYDGRCRTCFECRPHAGHIALAALERQYVAAGRSFTLITQNIDRLHQLAGSSGPIELHGTLRRWRCTRCGIESDWPAPAGFTEFPPLCACGGLLRPAVVWFGEMLPADAQYKAFQAAGRCDAFLSIGTSSMVYPAADLFSRARRKNALLIEINPEETPHSALCRFRFTQKAGELLPRLVETLGPLT